MRRHWSQNQEDTGYAVSCSDDDLFQGHGMCVARALADCHMSQRGDDFFSSAAQMFCRRSFPGVALKSLQSLRASDRPKTELAKMGQRISHNFRPIRGKSSL